MAERLPYGYLSKPTYDLLLNALSGLESGPLGKCWVDQIHLRVSQMNGCAFCIRLRTQELRAQASPGSKP